MSPLDSPAVRQKPLPIIDERLHGEKLSANSAEDSSSLQRGILYGGLASREETGDRPLMDSNSAAFKKMLVRAKERGYVTYDELNQFLPQDKLSSEQIEDSMAALSEMGITVIENEEPDDSSSEKEEETPVRPTGNLDDDDTALLLSLLIDLTRLYQSASYRGAEIEERT